MRTPEGGDRKRYKPSPPELPRQSFGRNELLCALRDSQTSSAQRNRLVHVLRDVLSNKLLPPLTQTEPNPESLRSYDKCFACEWVNDKYVAVGTKCNKLVLVNAITFQQHEIPLPPKPQRPSGMPLPGIIHPGCGIHGMSMSPDGSMFAVGGQESADCQLFQVEQRPGDVPVFTPHQTLVGHQDWVFGMAWLTDRHIATASRDHTLKLWRVDGQPQGANYTPLQSRDDHNHKVRDVKYSRDIHKLASLGADGTVKLWDPSLSLISSIDLMHKEELVCMAMQSNLVAVGSRSHVSLLDPRTPKSRISYLPSIDYGQGVRSLGIMGHILSSGSGRGRISFYDLRASTYISVRPEALSRPASAQSTNAHHLSEDSEEELYSFDEESEAERYYSSIHRAVRRQTAWGEYDNPMQRGCYLQTGHGWLDHNYVYMDHFTGMQIYNACYAHAWDPSNTKLFTCGGPLAFGLIGSYMALWD